MAYIYDLSDQWTAAGTTFTAIKMSVTDTASAAGSLLMDLQVGGFSQFTVSKAGRVVATALQGTGNSGSIEFSGPSAGIVFGGGGSGSNRFGYFNSSGGVERVTLANTVPFGWSSTSAATGTIDTILARDAANALAQRNGVNAQAFNLYNTYTDASNYERGFMQWVSNTLQIGTDKLGTGTARQLEFFTNGVARVRITSDGTLRGLSGYIYNLTSITGIWAAAAGNSYFGTESNHAIHIRTNNVERFAFDTVGSVRVSTALTVATLPATPLVGMVARVTDATAPVVGTTVTGGGAVAALCWYNGTNWTVIGV